MSIATLTRPAPDTTAMRVVHRVFRREFGLAPDLVRAVPDGDVARADYLGEHLSTVLDGLHHHHSVEDELLWPLLLERATLRADLVRRMEAQHARVAAFVTGIETLLPLWRNAAREDTRDRLAELLRELGRALDEHMAEEELEILPLVEEHVSIEEWAAIGERARAGVKRADMMTFLGALLEDAEPAEHDEFLGQLPPPVRLLWRAVGRRRYARTMSRLRTV
jgi:iron-sulfur cluster repair protein YtfE (RIC family)